MINNLILFSDNIDNIIECIESHLKEKYKLRTVVDIDTYSEEFAFIEVKLHKITYCIQIEITKNKDDIFIQGWYLINKLNMNEDHGEADFQIHSYDYNFENMFIDLYEQGKEMYKHYNHLKSMDIERKKYIDDNDLENLALCMTMDYIANSDDDY